jgi:hypothetical protein
VKIAPVSSNPQKMDMFGTFFDINIFMFILNRIVNFRIWGVEIEFQKNRGVVGVVKKNRL